MGDRPAEAVARDFDAMFRHGVLTGMSDAQLIERFATPPDGGGEMAFEVLVRRHGAMVMGVCRRVLGHDQSAEDAFQATFLVLALKARGIRVRDSLGPWLHGVAARIARRALAASRRHRHEPLPEEGPAVAGMPDPELADLGAAIDEELARLPDKYRLPVVLCYLKGQTQEEAARALGWTKGTVSGRLARAKDLLRHRLGRRGLAPSVAVLAAALAPSEVTAAVPASLVNSTVRTAIAAILGGAEAGAVAGHVTSLARGALKWLLVTRLVRAAVVSVLMLTTVAALAAPVLMPGWLPPRGNPLGRLFSKRGPAGARAALDPPAPRLDRYGDPLPAGAAVRLGTIQRRHTQRVVGLDLARGGKAVTVQDDGLLRLWDVETGRQLQADSLVDDAPGADRTIGLVAVSADGRFLATSGFDRGNVRPQGLNPVWIWKFEPHRLLRRLDVPALRVESLAISPDGTTIAVGVFSGEVLRWDVATGQRRATVKLGKLPISSLTYAPDGKSLVSTGQSRPVLVWDLEKGRGSALTGLKGSWSWPRFSRDGDLLAVPEVGAGIVLWDWKAGRTHIRIPGTVAVFAPDGRSVAVTGNGDALLTLLDTRDGRVRWKADLDWGIRQSGPIFSSDEKTILIEIDGEMRFLDAETGRERFGDDQTHPLQMSTVRYSPDGRRLLAGEYGGRVRIWDPSASRLLQVIGHRGRSQLLAVSPDGRDLAVARWQVEQSMSVWDLTTGRLRRDLQGFGDRVQAKALAFSPDGKSLLVYGNDHRLRMFKISTGREQAVVQPRFRLAEENPPLGPSFPPAKGKPPIDPWILAGDFSRGNRFLAVLEQRTVHVADMVTGEERFSGPGRVLAFTPDGGSLAIAAQCPPSQEDQGYGKTMVSTLDSDEIRLVDLDSGRDRRIAIRREQVQSLAFSPDGRLMAVAAGWRHATIRLYRTADGREIEAMSLPAPVTSRLGLAFSPDGRSLAAGLNDTTIPIWDVSRYH